MITLQKAEWGYLFSYGDNNVIDFTENTVTQILGVNGNGKSSIALILEEALFNKNSKGIKKADIPNRYSDKGYWLKLHFQKDGEQYRVETERKSATIKIRLFKDDVDISSHTATGTFKLLEELMGVDFKMFSQLVYQNSNSSLRFLVATDTERKKFLIDLLNLDDYVRMFEVFKEAAKQHATTVSKIEAQVETVKKWLDQNTLSDSAERELLPTDDYDTSAEERQIAELSVQISNIEKTNKQISNNNHYKSLLAAINIEEINAIDVQESLSYDKEQSELGGLTSDKRRITAYISKLSALGDTCPTCEQEVDTQFKAKLIEAEKEELRTVESRIAEVEELVNSIKSNNQRYQYKQSKIKEWEELFAKVNRSLPADSISKLDLEDQLTNVTLRVSNAREKMKSLVAHNQVATQHNSRVAVYREQSEKFLEELERNRATLAKESKNLQQLELLKKAFSTNGLIAYKIENLVKDLEELTNEYLAELSDGRFTIEFTVSSDKLNVIITDNGNTVDISALSSGELARVNTATLLALRKLMNSISKSRINVLFLDEVISVLDDPGREKLVEVLLQEELNTFIVSHGWSHPLLARLEIVKDDNMSRIEHG
jgi:DNA repair exonuclease SbcCD ATPase subunit